MSFRVKTSLLPQITTGILLLVLISTLVHDRIIASNLEAHNQRVVFSQAVLQSQQDIGFLNHGAPAERELKSGEAHAYVISLTADQYLRVLVDAKAIDLTVRLRAPNGQTAFESSGRERSVRFSSIATALGNYRLEIQAAQSKTKTGSYRITVEEIRASNAKDRDRIAGERALAEGTRLRAQQTGESMRAAIGKFDEAVRHFRTAEEREQEANALNLAGLVYRALNESAKARDYYKQALKASQEAGAREHEANALLNLGVISRIEGGNEQALEYYGRALEICRATGDRQREAAALFNMGAVYYTLGEPEKTLAHYSPALAIFRELGSERSEATVLNNLGLITNSLGQPSAALEHYQTAREIFRRIGDRAGEADILINTALIHQSTGSTQQALDIYDQALAIFRTASNKQREAVALNNIGQIYNTLGERQQALELYEQSLQLSREVKSQRWIAITLHNIGTVRLDDGNFEQALTYFNEALELHRSLGNRRFEAQTLDSIGTLHRFKGEPKKAVEQYDVALELRRATGDRVGEGSTLHNLGLTWSDLGDYDRAFEYFKLALELRETIGEINGKAESLYRLAGLEISRGNLESARSTIESALEIIESVRVGLASLDLRSSYLALKRDYYALYVDTLMRLHERSPSSGHDAIALRASERARARSLIDTLAETTSGIRQGAPAALLEREQSLQQQINAVEGHRLELLKGSPTEMQLQAVSRTLQNLLTQFQETRAKIRAASPRYAELTQPTPLTLKEIQSVVLDRDSAILEYLLGKERSFLFVVTADALHTFVLPPRAEIETIAKQVYSLLTARNQQASGAASGDRRTQIAEADAAFNEAGAALSRIVLGPALSLLQGKRLIVISEGALQYVPFAALPLPDYSAKSTIKGFTPLGVKHEITNLPSASALAVLRRQTAGREPRPRTLAVLADPVFRSDDSRIVRNRKESPAGPDVVESTQLASAVLGTQRMKPSTGGFIDLVRLRFSRQEAEGITAFAPPEGRFHALDFAASRESALSPTLGQYRIIHFATHGVLNSQHPELSGIVFSLVDEQGGPREGFLRLHEIYNMKLEADLVVLSACQTALGQDVHGEGLVGLTRGFMYAGAARVVASLWQVDDRATAELMKRFYREMLVRGQRPSAALRAAQLSMRSEKRWESPYFWAAFTLQGEWK